MKLIKYGTEWWVLHDDGAIERPGLGVPNAATWCVVGAVERNNFGHATKHYSLVDVLTKDIPWRFLNGKQRVYIRDRDHGTLREWRNSHHLIHTGAQNVSTT
ncbi:hypothetical protein [Polaromonas sp.]|uniref:hypothetical protein n=1 Tax=Polaromonas sp. TaxID=1869339 RepID=UPI0035629704